MKFCISHRTSTSYSEYQYRIGSFIVYTSEKVAVHDLLTFLIDYGIKIDGYSIEFESNEINSNFIYFDGSLLISNTLYYFKFHKNEIDNTGVLQRLTGPDYCNFGARTIFKGVKKSLPSQIYKFNQINLVSKEDSRKRLNYDKLEIDVNLIKKKKKGILKV